MASIEQMFQEKREGQSRKSQRIEVRIALVTKDQIEAELKRLWSLNSQANTRKRISKRDRVEASIYLLNIV